MSNRILVELTDLLSAEKELTLLMETLKHNEQDVKTLCNGISDWQGKSADELRNRLEAFSKGIAQQMNKLEMGKIELTHYMYRMKQADQ